MFKCGICGENSEEKEKASHVILETRKRTYNYGPGLVSTGWEIVKEVLAHAKCAITKD